MAQMNVSVPSIMKDWCEAQVRHGRYSTTSDYIRDLIRRDQDSHTGVRTLQAIIDEGLATGHPCRSFDEIADVGRWLRRGPNPGRQPS